MDPNVSGNGVNKMAEYRYRRLTLRFFENSAITPAASAWLLLTTCATHFATLGYDTSLGFSDVPRVSELTTCVAIWKSASTSVPKNANTESSAAPEVRGE